MPEKYVLNCGDVCMTPQLVKATWVWLQSGVRPHNYTSAYAHIHSYTHTYPQTFLFHIWVQHVLKRISVQNFFFYDEY